MSDRNFDDLAPRFARNVYRAHKGEVRQEVIQRDLMEFAPEITGEKSLRVFDAGGGQGQMTAYFAAQGHNVTLCDISEKMLDLATALISENKLQEHVTILHKPIQEVSCEGDHFDVVLLHAVLEWVEKPVDIIAHCLNQLKPGGLLSIIYYNRNGLVYKNLLRTNFKKFRKENWTGYRGSLTPNHPIEPNQCRQWVKQFDVNVCCESGIRVFSDYIFNKEDREREPETLLQLELEYSRQQPYLDLGRYIHMLLRKSSY